MDFLRFSYKRAPYGKTLGNPSKTGLSSVSLVSVFRQIRISRFDLFRSSVFQIRISRLDLFSSSVFQIRIDGSWAKWQCDGSFQIRTPCSNPHFSSSKSALPKSALLVQIRTSLRPNPHFPNPQFCEKKRTVESLDCCLTSLRILLNCSNLPNPSSSNPPNPHFSNPQAFFCKSAKSAFSKSARVFLSNPPNPHFQIRTRFFVKSAKSAFSNPQAFFVKSAKSAFSNPHGFWCGFALF